jgi:hypothetical protein
MLRALELEAGRCGVTAALAARAVLPIKRLLDFSAAQKQQVFGNNDA